MNMNISNNVMITLKCNVDFMKVYAITAYSRYLQELSLFLLIALEITRSSEHNNINFIYIIHVVEVCQPKCDNTKTLGR